VGTTSGIRMPTDLTEMVNRAASEDERTFSAEIRYLVKLGLERRNRDMSSGEAQDLRRFMDGCPAVKEMQALAEGQS